MNSPIRVETRTRAEADDLVEALRHRGIHGRRVTASDGSEVAINFEPSENEPLPLAAVVALEAWLLERRKPSIPIRVGGRRYELGPHPDAVEQEAESLLARLWHRLHAARRASATGATTTSIGEAADGGSERSSAVATQP
jgi:hypothetical protein